MSVNGPAPSHNFCMSASLYRVCLFAESYQAPVATQTERRTFFESFLEQDQIGSVHDCTTFRNFLRVTYRRNSQKHERVHFQNDWLANFFHLGRAAFKAGYIERCKAAFEELGRQNFAPVTLTGSQLAHADDGKTITLRVRHTTHAEECARARDRRSEDGSEGHGQRGKRKRDDETDIYSGNEGRAEQPHALQTPPIPATEQDVFQSALSNLPEPVAPTPTSFTRKLDRRPIEEGLKPAEDIYTSFYQHLGDIWNRQANYPAEPSPYLRALYETAFGHGWRTCIAHLQQDGMAENADILLTLSGAALYREVFQNMRYPESQLGKTASALAGAVAQALDEHMSYQTLLVSRPSSFVNADLRSEMVTMFEKALALKNSILDAHVSIACHWYHRGVQFHVESMFVDNRHARPKPGGAHLHKVAMCFLPEFKVSDDDKQGVLYRAVVKVGSPG